MKIGEFAKYLERLTKTSSRIEITKILADLFKKLSKEEVDLAVYMSLGILAPSFRGVVFNIAERMMIRAISSAYDVLAENVVKKYKEVGDLGIVASFFAKQKKSSLSIREVYEKLFKIASLEGDGSVEKKISETARLLRNLDPLSACYVVRIPIGRLRLGFSDKTVIDALSFFEVKDKSKSKKLEAAYQVFPDLGKIALAVKKVGIDKAVKNIFPEIGTPVFPMLAQRLKSADEIVKKMGQVAVEPKFDGLRVQIHYQDGLCTKAFTRNLNDVKEMFPELVNIGKYLKAASAILDSEAVGLDAVTMQMVDFQKTMARRRKHDIFKFAAQTPVTFQIFDVILLNGISVMGQGYISRREILKRIIRPNDIFVVDDYFLTNNPNEVRSKHKEFLEKGLEGAMIKRADSNYVPGRTGWRWIKMKEVEEASGKLADTVDCVIMGYSQGRGKRSVFGIGQFLAGIKSSEKFLTITKVGTGLTDEQFKELQKRLSNLVIEKKPVGYEVHKDLEPDFWVLPKVVVEIAADELTKSPKHSAGLALRFPRLVRFREDKSADQVTTLKEIQNLYRIQKR